MNLDYIKAYANVIKGMTIQEAIGVLKAYGFHTITVFTGLPDKGIGIMTKSLYLKRKKKCLECPLKNGNVCDPTRTRAHVHELDGQGNPLMVHGCSCGLAAKQKDFGMHCPAGEW